MACAKTYILKHILGKYVSHADIKLTSSQQRLFDEIWTRHQKGEPLSKIIGKKAFWKSDFITNEHTLDPRPETELIIEAVLEQFDTTLPYNILDLGAGTGCILLSLLQELPHAKGTGIDICPHALNVAKRNAERLNISCTLIQNNWLDGIKGPFDIIVCNPPYIEIGDTRVESSALFDPDIALFGGLDCYKTIFKDLASVMHSKSYAYFEIGQGQERVATMCESLTCDKMYKDLAGITRVLRFLRS